MKRNRLFASCAAAWLAAWLLAGCEGSAPASPTPTSPAAQAPGSSAEATSTPDSSGSSAGGNSTSTDEVCDLAVAVWGDQFKAGDKGWPPADFPAPPPKAKLCGSHTTDDGSTVIYSYASAEQDPATWEEEIAQHFLSALTAKGYTVQQNPTPPGVSDPDLGLTFQRGDTASLTGNIIVLWSKPSFEVIFPKAFKSGRSSGRAAM